MNISASIMLSLSKLIVLYVMSLMRLLIITSRVLSADLRELPTFCTSFHRLFEFNVHSLLMLIQTVNEIWFRRFGEIVKTGGS